MRDIGANLANPVFSAHLPAILERAQRVGLTHIDVTGTNLDSSLQAIRLSEQHPDFLSASAGVHPHSAKDWNASSQVRLSQLLAHPQVLMAGEMGLDSEHVYSPYSDQLGCFSDQLQLAATVGKPLFLHFRGAQALSDGLRLYTQYAPHLKGLVHCFTGNLAQADQILNVGLDIGITGWICDPRRRHTLLEALPIIPLSRIHIETDAPYLLPKNKPNWCKGSLCEPADLLYVAQELASLLSVDLPTLQHQTQMNSQHLIGLPPLGLKASSHKPI